MRIKHNELKLKLNILEILALYCVVWAVSPVLQYGTLFRLSVVFAAGVWLLVSAWESIQRRQKCGVVIAVVMLFCISVIFVSILMGAGVMEAIIQRLHMMIFLLFLCMGLYYAENNPKFLQKAMPVAVLLTAVFCLITFREYQITPNISRLLVYSDDIAVEYARRGVGGYGLIYSSVGMYGVALYQIFTNKVKFWVVYAGAACVIAITVLSSGYLIATILTCIVSLCFVFQIHKQKKLSLTILILFIVSIATWWFINKVVIDNSDKIISLLSDTQYALKAKEILGYLQGDEMSGHLGGRVTRYGKSFTAAMKHFVLGAMVTNKMDEVGGHSTLLDIISTFGIIFSWGYYYVLYRAIKSYVQYSKTIGFVCLMVMIFILNGVLDTYTGEMGAAYFIALPAAILYCKQVERTEKS